MMLDTDIFQYPDMFNLEIMSTDTISNRCKYKTLMESTMKNLINRRKNTNSTTEIQCKILWTDVIFIYGNINIIKGGQKKHIHNKQFNKYFRKIQTSKIKTKKNKISNKISKHKTVKIIY